VHCSLYKKAVSPLGGLQPRRPLVLRSLPFPHAFFKSMYCTWKSSQSYIIISMMTSFMRMSQKLVFHQSKCICAIKRILSTTAMYVSSSSFMYLRIPCYCDACLNSIALRVGVKTLLNTIQVVMYWREAYVVTWLNWIRADGDGAWRHEWGMKLCYKLKMHRGIDGMFAFSCDLCSCVPVVCY